MNQGVCWLVLISFVDAFVSHNQSPTSAPNTNSSADALKVVCVYQLPLASLPYDSWIHHDGEELRLLHIPPGYCDEFLVQGFKLKRSNVESLFRDYLTFFTGEMNPVKMFHATTTVSFKCDMHPVYFKRRLTGSKWRTDMIKQILDLCERYNFDHVELDCDHQLTEETADNFMLFIDELNVSLMTTRKYSESLLSLRIPLARAGLASFYNIKLLDNLKRIYVDLAQAPSNNTQFLSPLYNLRSAPGSSPVSLLLVIQYPNQKSSLSNWADFGLNKSKVVLLLPAFGHLYKFSNSVAFQNSEGLVSDGLPQVVKREKICEILESPEINSTTALDIVAASAVSLKNEWLSYESDESVKYKVKFAAENRLTGVGVLTLNDDDHLGQCVDRRFHLLKLVRHLVHGQIESRYLRAFNLGHLNVSDPYSHEDESFKTLVAQIKKRTVNI